MTRHAYHFFCGLAVWPIAGVLAFVWTAPVNHLAVSERVAAEIMLWIFVTIYAAMIAACFYFGLRAGGVKEKCDVPNRYSR